MKKFVMAAYLLSFVAFLQSEEMMTERAWQRMETAQRIYNQLREKFDFNVENLADFYDQAKYNNILLRQQLELYNGAEQALIKQAVLEKLLIDALRQDFLNIVNDQAQEIDDLHASFLKTPQARIMDNNQSYPSTGSKEHPEIVTLRKKINDANQEMKKLKEKLNATKKHSMRKKIEADLHKISEKIKHYHDAIKDFKSRNV